MATTTDISTLKINYLTQAQYDTALANNQINANELYLTPAAPVGSVTSISVSNATDGGLTISGSPVTTSGTITIGHSNVLSSAQTTQAVYPIKIDKNGHISAYGSAVTIPTNTDEKVKLTSTTTSGNYPIVLGPTSITSGTAYNCNYNTGITVNPNTKTVTATTFVGALTGTASGNLTSSSTLDATKLSGTIPASCYTDTNTTYALSGALSSHAFTSTLTAGGSGSGTSTSVLTLAEGTGISLTDDTTNKKITIGHSNSVTASTAGTSSATSGSTLAVPYVTYDAQGHITATGTHTHTVTGFVPTTRTVNGKALSANVADADYITEQGNKTASSITWNYRRTNGGDADAWATVSWSSTSTSVWSTPVRYKDLTISIPSGIFSAAPRITATSTSTQYWVAGVTVSSATSATIRFATVATGNFAFQAYVYAFGS